MRDVLIVPASGTIYFKDNGEIINTITEVGFSGSNSQVTGTFSATDMEIVDTNPSLLFRETDNVDQNIKLTLNGGIFSLQEQNDDGSTALSRVYKYDGSDGQTYIGHGNLIANGVVSASGFELQIGSSANQIVFDNAGNDVGKIYYDAVSAAELRGLYIQAPDVSSRGVIVDFPRTNNFLGIRNTSNNIVFKVDNNGQVSASSLAITDGADSYIMGNVGIGTTNPSGSIHLYQSAGLGALRMEGANAGNASPIFQLSWLNTDSQLYEAAKIASFNAGAVNDGDLRFYTTQNAVMSEAVRIDEDGNVGIGTSNPDVLLHVAGDAKIDGILFAQEFQTSYVSSSIVYSSGSTQFGDSADDIHSFTGSVDINGDLDIRGGSISVRNSPTATGFAELYYNSGTGILEISKKIHVTATGYSQFDELHVDDEVQITGSVNMAGEKYIYIGNTKTGGNGGFLQGTVEAAGGTGYGMWMNYNAYYNGSNWIQPRGTLGSLLYTTNFHEGFAWFWADAGSVDEGSIDLTNVARLTQAGDFSSIGDITISGSVSASAYNRKVNIPFVYQGSAYDGHTPPVRTSDIFSAYKVTAKTISGSCYVNVVKNDTMDLHDQPISASNAGWTTSTINSVDFVEDDDIRLQISESKQCIGLSVNVYLSY